MLINIERHKVESMKDVTLREAPLRFTSSLGEGDEARKADTLN